MKKFISILLCAFFGFSLCAGCSDNTTVKTSKAASNTDSVQVTSNPDWPDGTVENLSQYDVNQYNLKDYTVPVWNDGGIARCETVFVMQESDGSIAPISMLYPAKQIVSVRNYGLNITYRQGKDYSLTKDGKLQVIKGGAIKSMPYSQFYPSVYDPSSSANNREVYGIGAQIYTEAIKDGDKHNFGMTEWQITVTYRHSALWDGSIPDNQSRLFKETNSVLKGTAANRTLKIACLGDSISQGWGSSGYENVDIAPHMPPYIGLFQAALQSKCKNTTIELKNFSLAGKTSRWPLYEEDGIQNFNELLQYKPDLVVLAFGMNDGGGIAPQDFSDNMENIVKKILANRADTEIVLVSCMLPNQEIRVSWGNKGPICNYQPAYKAVLKRISVEFQQEGKTVAFADVLSVYQQIIKTKRFEDITSNNCNHPNDYMHRVYAQVILRTVIG